MAKVIRGFRWAGLSAGIKTNGKPDLALLVADRPVSAAGVFTRNLVRAAPVEVAERHVKAGRAQAVLVNAGNANACTGAAGMRGCRATVRAVARELGVSEQLVIPASTGVIGRPLPIGRIEAGIPKLVESLRPAGITAFSRAIITTDRGPKVAHVNLRVGTKRASLVAVAKGAGMIHPDMATTLAFVATDAEISPVLLRAALRAAVDRTFNALSVDGDTSTNDTIVVMASGASGLNVTKGRPETAFRAALEQALGQVGEMIVADGEGAEHVVRIDVSGAPSDGDAQRVASVIARSLLVKTALYGKDPNWGRILAAAGRAGVRFDPARTTLRIGGVLLSRRGLAIGEAAEARVARVMRKPRYTVTLDLGAGRGKGHYLTCDIGHGYVNVNADYHT